MLKMLKKILKRAERKKEAEAKTLEEALEDEHLNKLHDDIYGATGAPSPVIPTVPYNSKGSYPSVQSLQFSTTKVSTPTVEISSPDPGPSVVKINGADVVTVFSDELPQEATVGQIAFLEGVSAAQVFDGEEWVNLGVAVRMLSKKDDKCDRRGAIAATKKKRKLNG